METINPAAMLRGRVRVHRVHQDGYHSRRFLRRLGGPGSPTIWGWERTSPWRHNDIMYDWATIGCNLFAAGDADYKIAGMYIEYKNVADPADPVPVPAFGRGEGISYYNGLSGSPDIDYLRVPLTAATVSTSDAVKFPLGNVMTFFAMTQGVTGVHGKAFSDTANSKVYGGALVAIPDAADRTRDLVLARFYLDVADQQVKLATSQVGLEWEEELQ